MEKQFIVGKTYLEHNHKLKTMRVVKRTKCFLWIEDVNSFANEIKVKIEKNNGVEAVYYLGNSLIA